jgi:hypothetical protein
MLVEMDLMTIRWRLVGLKLARRRRDAPALESILCVSLLTLGAVKWLVIATH